MIQVKHVKNNQRSECCVCKTNVCDDVCNKCGSGPKTIIDSIKCNPNENNEISREKMGETIPPKSICCYNAQSAKKISLIQNCAHCLNNIDPIVSALPA